MFATTFQSGFLSVFYSVGSNPLSLWDKTVKNGHIRRVVDEEVKSLVLEISGTNVATTYITCPIKPRASLGVKLPFLVLVLKNLKKYFTFEIQILDDKNMRRRFRVSNFQSTTKVRPFCTTMPVGLSNGWNQIQFNLADFTRRAYGTTYLETVRVQIHANVRIRRIYFSDKLYSEEELPTEYKLIIPTTTPLRKSTEAPKKLLKSMPPVKVPEEELQIPSGAPPTPTEPEVEIAQVNMQADDEVVKQVPSSAPAVVGDVADMKDVDEVQVPLEDVGVAEETAEATEFDAAAAGAEEAPAEAAAPALIEGEAPGAEEVPVEGALVPGEEDEITPVSPNLQAEEEAAAEEGYYY